MKSPLIAFLIALLVCSCFFVGSVRFGSAQTIEAKILSYSWYTAPSSTSLAEYIGDLVAVGEVENVGTTPLGTIVIAGMAYNSTGQVVCTAEAPIIGVPELLPKQKAPFYMDFTPENSVTQDQSWVPTVSNVTVIVNTVLASNQTQYSGLTAGSLNGADIGGVYTLTGSVTNSGPQTVGDVWAITTFYNAAGKVVSLNYTNFIVDSLGTGNSAPFLATPTDNTLQTSSEIANYSVLVESSPLSANPTPTPNLATPTPSSPSSSTQPTATPVNRAETYGAVAAAVVVAAVIAALVLVRSRRKKSMQLPPPPPPPPP